MFYYITNFRILWTFVDFFIIIMLMGSSTSNHKKLIILICILVILFGAGALVYNAMKSAKLSILVAPNNAVVRIDGKEYQNGQYKFFPKSNVEVEIASDGYQTQHLVVDLLPKQTTLLRAVLEDEEGGYESYLLDNDRYNLVKLIAPEIGNSELTSFIESVDKKLKILGLLPVNENTGEFYKDQHGFFVSMDDNAAIIQIMASNDEGCNVVPCLEIFVTDGDISKVRSFLTKKGYNLDDYSYELSDIHLYEPEYVYLGD